MTAADPSKDASDAESVAEVTEDPPLDINSDGMDYSHDYVNDMVKQSDNENIRKIRPLASKRYKGILLQHVYYRSTHVHV